MTSSNTPQFNVSASLIRRLGEVIVPDAVHALTELIKNAYDADADRVTIEVNTKQTTPSTASHFKPSTPGYIIIEDNGKGMSWAQVQSNWMNFSFSEKGELKAKAPTGKKRSLVGGQGLGRLGTVHLGECVEIFTAPIAAEKQSHGAFDWKQFTDNRPLTAVSFFAEQIPNPSLNGTYLLIHPLKNHEQWKDNNGNELATQLKEKISLFADPNSFRVTIKIDGDEVPLGARKNVLPAQDRVYIEDVWQKMTPELISHVIKFWDDNKMLRPGFSSEARARQVVLIVRREVGKEIVGLSTAELITFKQLNSNNFYMYRSIVLPGFRHPGLASKIIVETRDLLETYNKTVATNPCIGMITFVENPRIQEFRREAIWRASKMAYIGMDKQGRHIRVYYFKGATI